MMQAYKPEPVDTTAITLSSDLTALTEQLARNAHEVWASQRMSEGWRFGDRRDDDAKTHPGLIPYGELSESEKEYDRKTAMETLRTIIYLGYIVRHGDL